MHGIPGPAAFASSRDGGSPKEAYGNKVRELSIDSAPDSPAVRSHRDPVPAGRGLPPLLLPPSILLLSIAWPREG